MPQHSTNVATDDTTHVKYWIRPFTILRCETVILTQFLTTYFLSNSNQRLI